VYVNATHADIGSLRLLTQTVHALAPASSMLPGRGTRRVYWWSPTLGLDMCRCCEVATTSLPNSWDQVFATGSGHLLCCLRLDHRVV
jgi:hypothetical protein